MTPETDATEAMRERMRATSDGKERAEIAGLKREPFKDSDPDQSCADCIYFLPNHAHCSLPELDIPVNSDWWCRLYRI